MKDADGAYRFSIFIVRILAYLTILLGDGCNSRVVY